MEKIYLPFLVSTIVYSAFAIFMLYEKDNLRNELKTLKQEAVSKQYAEWEVLEHGQTQFKWK
jgi:predicted PurR-regulated permease PerM